MLHAAHDELPADHQHRALVGRWGGRVRVVRVPGTHETFASPPHVDVLAAELQKLLNEL
jgi:hypothetical protein